MADLATSALEDAVKKGVLKSALPPRALMLVVWGQMLGVIQVLSIRRENFEKAFGLTQDELVDHFIKMLAVSLK